MKRVTPRQREALTLIALGHATKTMADAMGVSFKTANKHRQAAMRNIGAHTVAEVIRYVVLHDWIAVAQIGQSAVCVTTAEYPHRTD